MVGLRLWLVDVSYTVGYRVEELVMFAGDVLGGRDRVGRRLGWWFSGDFGEASGDASGLWFAV